MKTATKPCETDMQNAQNEMVRSLNSVLKKLDTCQDLLGMDDQSFHSKVIDKADNTLLSARTQLLHVIAQLDPQSVQDRKDTERRKVMDDLRHAEPGVVPASYLVYHLNHQPAAGKQGSETEAGREARRN
jgi:hypothetical protein